MRQRQEGGLRRRRLDVTGTLCPVPIILTAREIRHLEPGESLEVVGDDPGILHDMPAWCQSTGFRLREMKEVDGQIHCIVDKTAESA